MAHHHAEREREKNENTMTVLPPHIKREQEEDDEQARRVSRHTEAEEALHENIMKMLVLKDLQSDNTQTLERATKNLFCISMITMTRDGQRNRRTFFNRWAYYDC